MYCHLRVWWRIQGVLCGFLEVRKGLHTVNSNVWWENQAREQAVLPGQPFTWFLKASSVSRYVYIPAGGSQHGLLGTLFSTAMTFAFVSFWHGGNDYLWCWATLNWLGVTVENGVQRLVQAPRVQDSLVSWVLACAVGDSHARWTGFGREGGHHVYPIVGHSC